MRKNVATIAAIGVLAGCGGSTASSDTVAKTTGAATTQAETTLATETTADTAPESEPTDQALVDAYWQYDEAYKSSDAAAFYDLYSSACHDKYNRTQFAALIEVGHTFIEEYFGLGPDEVSNGDPSIDREGDSAVLTYELQGPDGRAISDEPNVATWIFEDGRWVRDSCDFDDVLGTNSESDNQEADGPGSRDNPIPMGTAVDVGSGWTLKVNSASVEGTEEILAANEFNDLPPDGKQYVLVNVTAGYTGPDDSSVLSVELKVLGESTNKPTANYETTNAVVPPEPQFLGNELFKDGEETGNVVFEIDSTDAETLVLIGQSFGSGRNSDRKFFALEPGE